MAYPTSFLRLAVIGTLFGTETFTWSLALRDDFGDNPDPEVVPQGVIDAVVAYHTAGGVGTGTQAALTAIKLNRIGTDGRYVSSGDTVLHEFETPVPGVGTAVMPPQCALAVTLRTARRRGRASSGRFYLPHLAGSPGSDGRLTEGQAQAVAIVTTTFLNSLKTALNGDFLPAVLSDIGTGAVETVTHVEVGRTIDTMRSRRTSLPEDYYVGEPLAP